MVNISSVRSEAFAIVHSVVMVQNWNGDGEIESLIVIKGRRPYPCATCLLSSDLIATYGTAVFPKPVWEGMGFDSFLVRLVGFSFFCDSHGRCLYVSVDVV
jgi:hypothetical protein